MKDGNMVSYERYDDDLKKYVYNVKSDAESTQIYNKIFNVVTAYDEYLKTTYIYWNIDELPALPIRRKFKKCSMKTIDMKYMKKE